MTGHPDDNTLLLMFLAFLAAGMLALQFGPVWFFGGGLLALLIGAAVALVGFIRRSRS